MPAPESLTAEGLFERYFLPLYPADARDNLKKARSIDANPAGNLRIFQSIDEVAVTFIRVAPSVFEGMDLGLDGSDASVHRLSAALDREKRDRWAREQGPDGASLLSHVVVHGSIYVGHCVVGNHGASWQVRRPLWESMVRLKSPAGEADLAIFHWWMKSLSDAEVDRHTLSDRYRAYVEEPRQNPDSLRPILPDARPIPRLSKVRYDTLYKHLRAHLPELRDLGEHFPSAERLAELKFRHLDFLWLGGTRMLLLHGPAEKGVHLFWLSRQGFSKAAYYPADPGSGYDIALVGDMLRVTLSFQGSKAEHIMLFWGP